MSGRRILVTGGAGFIGSNLADRLAGNGNAVVVYDALARPGVERNLAWLQSRHGERIEPIVADVRDGDRLRAAVRSADAVFHLAAQVAVTTSMTDPADDLGINIGGTFNVLEAVRSMPRPIPVIFASTNKVYGDLSDFGSRLTPDGYVPTDGELAQRGVPETQPLDFHTPYGCSKGAADQYVLDYCRSYGVPTAVLRMSCIYGRRQMGTEDQGWVAHFLIRALEGRPITVYGDGQQVRDVLHVDDAVDTYVAALGSIGRIAGRAFNLGGGPANAVSLAALLEHMRDHLGLRVEVERAEWRPGDQRWFVADTRAIDAALQLKPRLDWRSGLGRLLAWLEEDRADPVSVAPPLRVAAR